MHSPLHYLTPIGMYKHGFEKHTLPDISKWSSLSEMGAGRNPSHWIIESADYLLPIKMVILSTELFSVFTNAGGLLLYLLYHALSHDGNAMHFGLPSCFCMHQTSLK